MKCEINVFTDGNKQGLMDQVNPFLHSLNLPTSNVRVEFSTHPNPAWVAGSHDKSTIFSAMVTHYS